MWLTSGPRSVVSHTTRQTEEGVKLRQEGGVALADIFRLIDAMPIRQQEMKERRGKAL